MDLITRNWRLKLAAVGLAVGMWLAVVYVSNPPAVRTVMVGRVQVLGLARNLVLVQHPGGPGGVALQVAGLASNVEARTRVLAALRLSIDLAGVRAPGRFEVPLTVRNQDRTVEVLSWPSRVAVQVDRRITAEIPVRAVPRGRSPSGFSAQVTGLTPNTVRVTGPLQLVRQVRAVVHPSVAGLRTTVSQSFPVSLVGLSRARRGVVGISPVEVTALIAVSSQESTRTLPVVVTLAGGGQPPIGTELTDVRSFPSTVVATGPAAVLNGLVRVATKSVDVSGAAQGLTAAARLTAPPGVTLSPATVTVVVSVTTLPRATPVPTAVPTARPTRTPGPTPSPRPTRSPTPTPSPKPTRSPAPTPSPTRTPTPPG